MSLLSQSNESSMKVPQSRTKKRGRQHLSLTSALWLSFLFGTGALLGGRSLQHFVQVKPCALCLYQQITLGAIGFFSLISLLMRQNKYQKITAGLTVAFVFLNFGIAAYHVGVEQHLIPTLAYCRVGGNPSATGIDALRQSLLETEVVPCDKIKWTFLGLSMASYNMLLSSVVFVFWIIVLRSRRKSTDQGCQLYLHEDRSRAKILPSVISNQTKENHL